jgi:hypothetical protein
VVGHRTNDRFFRSRRMGIRWEIVSSIIKKLRESVGVSFQRDAERRNSGIISICKIRIYLPKFSFNLSDFWELVLGTLFHFSPNVHVSLWRIGDSMGNCCLQLIASPALHCLIWTEAQTVSRPILLVTAHCLFCLIPTRSQLTYRPGCTNAVSIWEDARDRNDYPHSEHRIYGHSIPDRQTLSLLGETFRSSRIRTDLGLHSDGMGIKPKRDAIMESSSGRIRGWMEMWLALGQWREHKRAVLEIAAIIDERWWFWFPLLFLIRSCVRIRNPN